MKISKTIARKLLFPLGVGLHLEKLFRTGKVRNIVNIYYHGVVQKDSLSLTPRHLHIKQFEKQLIYFKNNFDVFTLDQAFDEKSGLIKTSRSGITISFDDGYLNNLTNALPLLEKYEIPATFFVSGICTEDNNYKLLWADIVTFALHLSKNKGLRINNLNFVDGFCESINKSIFDYIKSQPCEERNEILELLVNDYKITNFIDSIDPEIWKLMNSSDIKSSNNSPFIQIESHGYNHYNLGNIDLALAVEDMSKSKKSLEKVINNRISTICFPDGSYNMEVVNAAKNLGYSKFVACNYNDSNHKQLPDLIDRHGVSNTTTYESNIFFINKRFKTK
jgi:peptidoglycan/xylan/chitin deacetylase (PgdA/CDA1 family)